MVPGFLATHAIFFFVFLREVLKMVLMSDDLPELDLPTNTNYFYFLNKVLSSSSWVVRNLGSVL